MSLNLLLQTFEKFFHQTLTASPISLARFSLSHVRTHARTEMLCPLITSAICIIEQVLNYIIDLPSCGRRLSVKPENRNSLPTLQQQS